MGDKNVLFLGRYPKNFEEACSYKYKFWPTQPVPDLKDKVTQFGNITDSCETDKEKDLPKDFIWHTVDINSDADMGEVSSFLTKFHNSGKVQSVYTEEFIRWVLPNPDTTRCYAIKVKDSGLMVGFVCGTKLNLQVGKHSKTFGYVPFLCVHPKLRNKNMATVLIRRIKNGFIDTECYCGFFTSNNYIPKPFTSVQKYSRALNVDRLVEDGFLQLEGTIKIDDVKKTLKLPNMISNSNFIKMEEVHIDGAYELLTNYLQRYSLFQNFTKDEFTKYFYNNNVVTSCVLLDDNGSVVDFVSYYKLALRRNGRTVTSANLWYYTSAYETSYRLIRDTMIIAKRNDVDIFTATDIAENHYILGELDFEKIPNSVHYNFVNWLCPELQAKQIALTPI